MADNGSGARVLVTRPLDQAHGLVNTLKSRGFSPLLQPLLEIVPAEKIEQDQRQILLELDNYRHIIFVSTNAVRWGMQAIKKFWPQLPTGIHWHAIGAATAEALAKLSIDVASPDGDMNSEALLDSASLQQVADENILIVRGQGGRTLMARVSSLEIYQRRLPKNTGPLLADTFSQGVDAILISSGEGLMNLVSMLEGSSQTGVLTDTIYSLPLVVPGTRVAALAAELGFKDILEAENATDAAMIKALCSSCSQQQ
jgi:uroporphyrinogen-III synthase